VGAVELPISTAGGLGDWRDEFGDDLIGRRVIVIPDNDTPGHDYKDKIVASSKKRGIEYLVVDLAPYVKEGLDMSASSQQAPNTALQAVLVTLLRAIGSRHL
jgi:hypothetical protein